jgi:hypothetical protein
MICALLISCYLPSSASIGHNVLCYYLLVLCSIICQCLPLSAAICCHLPPEMLSTTTRRRPQTRDNFCLAVPHSEECRSIACSSLFYNGLERERETSTNATYSLQVHHSSKWYTQCIDVRSSKKTTISDPADFVANDDYDYCCFQKPPREVSKFKKADRRKSSLMKVIQILKKTCP